MSNAVTNRRFLLIYKSVVSGDLCGGNQDLTADNVITALGKWLVNDIDVVREHVHHKNLAKGYVHKGGYYMVIRVK